MKKCGDSWRDIDKLIHCGVCLAISVISPEAAVGAALAKEYGDMRAHGNHWCWKDIAADALGILLGAALHFAVICIII